MEKIDIKIPGRRIVQIAPSPTTFFGITQDFRLFALCDDSTVWYRDCTAKDSAWRMVDDKIPSGRGL